MATRDLSPSSWNAPGTAQAGLNVILSANTSPLQPMPLPIWLNNYAPLQDETMTLASGFNSISINDTTNTRFCLMIPPAGNAVTITLKGITGDTGLSVNPNGFIFFTPASGATAVGITTGSTLAGFRFLCF